MKGRPPFCVAVALLPGTAMPPRGTPKGSRPAPAARNPPPGADGGGRRVVDALGNLGPILRSESRAALRGFGRRFRMK
jgi:hypothetical protein